MSDHLIEVLKEAAPYIDAYRKKKFVLLLPYFKDLSAAHFNSIVNDVVLLKKLGLDVILVLNNFKSIPLNEKVDESHFLKYKRQINKVKKTLTTLLTYHQCQLKRIFIEAVNFGVFNGRDTEKLAELRKCNLDTVYQNHSSSQIYFASPIAKNKKAEELFIHPVNLAVALATRLKAEKLIIYTHGLKKVPISYHLREIQANYQPLFKQHALHQSFQAFFDTQDFSTIKRTHFIEKESLLKEIFSIDGSGILINTDDYEQIRPAMIEDVYFIQKLIDQNLKQQALIYRERKVIEEKINQFYVIDREGYIIGSVGLEVTKENPELAEMYSFVIHKDYQGEGRATALLKFIEKKAKKLQLTAIFVRTTRIETWFIDQGFKPISIDTFSLQFQSQYNQDRKSKILLKSL